jgi:hypothetical protein
VPASQIEPQLSRPVGQVSAVSAAIGGLIATAAALGIGRFVYTPILPCSGETRSPNSTTTQWGVLMGNALRRGLLRWPLGSGIGGASGGEPGAGGRDISLAWRVFSADTLRPEVRVIEGALSRT